MPSHERSAAVAPPATPESTESYSQQLVAARLVASRSTAALAALCASPSPEPAELVRLSDEALTDIGRVRGLAALVRRLS